MKGDKFENWMIAILAIILAVIETKSVVNAFFTGTITAGKRYARKTYSRRENPLKFRWQLALRIFSSLLLWAIGVFFIIALLKG